MKNEPQSDPGMQKLADLIDEVRIAMLTTEEPDGSLRSRPLATFKQSYVSICGSARLFRDRDKMQELSTPWVEPWFPNGLGNPDLALLEITVNDAEYWDAPASRTRRLFGFAKALTTGSTDELGEPATPRHYRAAYAECCAQSRFARRKSATKARYSRAFSASLRSRNRNEGWMVTNAIFPSARWCVSARALEMVTGRPKRLRAAVAPSAMIARGSTILSSWSSHHLHWITSPVFGRLCRRRLPRISCLKCLTAFVT
jgi:general stress protein 26